MKKEQFNEDEYREAHMQDLYCEKCHAMFE